MRSLLHTPQLGELLGRGKSNIFIHLYKVTILGWGEIIPRVDLYTRHDLEMQVRA